MELFPHGTFAGASRNTLASDTGEMIQGCNHPNGGMVCRERHLQELGCVINLVVVETPGRSTFPHPLDGRRIDCSL